MKSSKSNKSSSLSCSIFFYIVIDLQLQKLNNRFIKANTELLLCVASLDSSNSFSAYDWEKLVHVVEFYPCNFSRFDHKILHDKLETYVDEMHLTNDFFELRLDILVEKMIGKKKDVSYPLI